MAHHHTNNNRVSDMTTPNEQPAATAPHDTESDGDSPDSITELCASLLNDRGVSDRCSIEIVKRGCQITFFGWVDSQQTKAELFHHMQRYL